MAKLNLTDVSGGYNLVATYNANNAAIEAAMENTLSRDGTTPNTMSADLDMNSQRITNVAEPTNNADAVPKSYVETRLTAVAGGDQDWNTAVNYDVVGFWSFDNGLLVGESSTLTIEHTNAANYVDLQCGGTDFNITANGVCISADWTGFTGFINFWDGTTLRLWDADDNDWFTIDHDGTKVTLTTGGSDAGNVPILFNGTDGIQFGDNIYLNTGGVTPAVSGYGQLYTDSNTEELNFRDADNHISSLSKQVKIKSADETVNNSSTLQDDDDWASFKVQTGGRYRMTVRAKLVQGNATPGIRMKLVCPTATETNPLVHAWVESSTARDFTVTTAGFEVLLSSTAGTNYLEYVCEFDVTVIADTSVKIQWAQQSGHASNTVLSQNSSAILERID